MMSPLIHPTAIIDKKSKIGNNVRIGAFCVIGKNVILRDDVSLHSHVVVEGPTVIGRKTQIFQFSVIGTPAQHNLFEGEPASLEIGEENIIREKVSIHRGTKIGGMKTVVGDNNFILADCHIAHDCKVGNNNILANCVALGGHVTLGNNCYMGAYSAVQQFVRIGDIAMIGAMAKVTEDIIPYSIADGMPCRLRSVNTIGLHRQNFSKGQISEIRAVYKAVFKKGGDFASRLVEARKLLNDPESVAWKLLEFIRMRDKRPICMQNKAIDIVKEG